MAAPKGNQYGRGHHFGRPLKFKDPIELQKRIDAYFADCDVHLEEGMVPTPYIVDMHRGKERIRVPVGREKPNEWRMIYQPYVTKQKPYTVTGLACWLDTDRELLLNYQRREGFSEIIERAKTKIEAFWETALWDEKVNTQGVIFNLKNNWGWKDRVEVVEREMETGFEHLTDEELQEKLEELRKGDEAFSDTIRA